MMNRDLYLLERLAIERKEVEALIDALSTIFTNLEPERRVELANHLVKAIAIVGTVVTRAPQMGIPPAAMLATLGETFARLVAQMPIPEDEQAAYLEAWLDIIRRRATHFVATPGATSPPLAFPPDGGQAH